MKKLLLAFTIMALVSCGQEETKEPVQTTDSTTTTTPTVDTVVAADGGGQTAPGGEVK